MPIANYSLLIGRATDIAFDDDASPHIEVRIDAGGSSYRIAVNVRSQEQPSALLYARRDPWQSPLTGLLAPLSDGLVDVRGTRPDLALDYVHGGFLRRDEMAPVPYRADGPANDLREFLVPMLEQAIADASIRLFAFGEAWGPEAQPDAYFHFMPGRGIHDIHMNQGSQGRFAASNGPQQDGALAFHLPGEDRWVIVFLAFQSQDWQVAGTGTGTGTGDMGQPREPFQGTVGIVAALVNPPNPEEGRESVTLLNRSDGIVDLTGWRIADGEDRSDSLDGLAMGPGEALRVHLTGNGARLSNKGNTLRLLTRDGMVAHQVRYAKADVGPEGWTVVF